MNSRKRPVSVLIVACAYLAVGSIGFVAHFPELLRSPQDSVLVELVELLGVFAGAFILRRRNWARWLALAWMAFHVVISFPAVRQVVIHSLLFGVIAWFLFRPDAARYFRGMGEAR